MSKNMMKACIAAATLAVGGAAHADNLTVTVAPAGALQGSVATAVMMVQLDDSYLFDGTTFTLDWTGGALELLPLQSSAAGMGFADVQDLFDPGLSSVSFDNSLGTLGVSAIFDVSVPAGPGTVPISLAFKGLTVGSHQVNYLLELSYLDPINFNVEALTRSGSFDVTISAIPEPATYALMLSGLIAVGALARRRRSAV